MGIPFPVDNGIYCSWDKPVLGSKYEVKHKQTFLN